MVQEFVLLAVSQVVQEYERAVIFRLGRLQPGGAKGPGLIVTNIIQHCKNAYPVFVLIEVFNSSCSQKFTIIQGVFFTGTPLKS